MCVQREKNILIEDYISNEGFYHFFKKCRQQTAWRSFIPCFSLCAEGFSLTIKINYGFAISTDENEIRPKLSSPLMVSCGSYGLKPNNNTIKKLKQPHSISPRDDHNFMVKVCPTDSKLFSSYREENGHAWISRGACHSTKHSLRLRFRGQILVGMPSLVLLGTSSAHLPCLSITAQTPSNLALRRALSDKEQHLMPHNRAKFYSI